MKTDHPFARVSDHRAVQGSPKKSGRKAAKSPGNNESLKSAVKRVKLKNGLSVLLIENHKSPVVSVQMWVKTGSADERRGEEGISHFIEHLVFKGTEKYGVGEIASTVEASGGELNAYTSFDQTVFYVNISKAFSDVALDVIAQMMGFPRFDPTEIDNEREVVIEEIKRSNDSPGRQASRLLFSTVYKEHPYGIPVIGYDRIIRQVSRQTLRDYYQSRYVPKNMHLVIAGDFLSAEMAQKVKGTFGQLRSYPVRAVKRKPEPKQTKSRMKVTKAPFEEAQFHIAWRIPRADHRDIAALDVLALILGQGESSRLARKLHMERPLANSIGAGTFTPKDNGLFTVSGSLNADQARAVFDGVVAEIGAILAEPPTSDEFKKAITNLESEEFYAMESIEGIARKAGSFENLMGDYAYFQKFLKQVYALKPEDIQKVARKYLVPETMNVVMMSPRDEKETNKLVRGFISAYAKRHALAKKQRTKPVRSPTIKKAKWSLTAPSESAAEIERYRLDSGVSVLFLENHMTPVFSAKAGFLGGVRSEGPGRAGVTELLSRVWASGTRSLSEAQISQKIENMAGAIGAFGGRNSAGLSMQMISPFESDALELFQEILTEPVIANAAVEREKVMMLEAIRSREDSPSQLVSQLFAETMFKGHPYSQDLYGSRESVQSLDRDVVEAHRLKMALAGNLTIVVAGSVDKDKWLASMEVATARLPKGRPLDSNFPHQGPRETKTVFKKLEREQSHIIIGYKGLTLTDPKRYTLQVIQAILAGQGGRLFLELRDKASLAYSVAPMRMEGVDTGYFGAYIGCTPAKGPKAIEMLRTEFQKLVDDSVPFNELERAKRYLIGRHDLDLQRNASIASSILFNEIYGINSEEMFRYAERVSEITTEDVHGLARQIFAQPFVLCAVGPEKPF